MLMLCVLLLKMIEHPKVPPLIEKKRKNQWLESPTGTLPPFPSDLSRFGARGGVCTCP